jgi:hypothetical protein
MRRDMVPACLKCANAKGRVDHGELATPSQVRTYIIIGMVAGRLVCIHMLVVVVCGCWRWILQALRTHRMCIAEIVVGKMSTSVIIARALATWALVVVHC